MDSVAQRWFGAFMETVKTHEASTTLREAAERGELKHWTQVLTGIVVGTFPEMGWRGAARGQTLVIVGSRSETVTFPYGFFKNWTLDANTARFLRH